MREIKFRAWDEQENKMVYNFRDTDRHAELNEMGQLVKSCWHTMMQYTGLKDMNQKEIFEGDIIQQHPKSKYNSWEVKYSVTCGFDLSDTADYEVIGNIYENPELIKQD